MAANQPNIGNRLIQIEQRLGELLAILQQTRAEHFPNVDLPFIDLDGEEIQTVYVTGDVEQFGVGRRIRIEHLEGPPETYILHLRVDHYDRPPRWMGQPYIDRFFVRFMNDQQWHVMVLSQHNMEIPVRSWDDLPVVIQPENEMRLYMCDRIQRERNLELLNNEGLQLILQDIGNELQAFQEEVQQLRDAVEGHFPRNQDLVNQINGLAGLLEDITFESDDMNDDINLIRDNMPTSLKLSYSLHKRYI